MTSVTIVPCARLHREEGLPFLRTPRPANLCHARKGQW